MPTVIALWCIAGLFGTAVLAVALARAPAGNRTIYGLSCVLSAAAAVGAFGHLLGAPTADETVILPLGLPWLGAHFRIDALAAFFLLVINLGGAMASFYALGYGRHEAEPMRVLPYYPAFLAGMNLVVLADDAFTFLLCWEFMSLSSWALVMAHHREGDNIRAGYVYLLLASFGTMSLLLAFGLLAGPQGGYAFEAIRAGEHTGVTTVLALALVLLGTGSKAGLVPLHVWLPLAHPAAPTHVSALMSGVMTKVAIYGFVRIVFDLLGEPSWWWGAPPLVLGAGSAVLGLLYALWQTDLKRMLAYSTVENVGVVFVGLGLALAFQANGMAWAAALALTASLFHVLNHSLFKSLLFFGAGAVLTTTGERNMERLGGLIQRMPLTSFAFLVGCAAISSLPPLNGFVSEWLMFQAILQSPELPQWGLKVVVPAAGALLALSAGLAVACFVRAFGVTFLSRPRSAEASQASEVDRFSTISMLVLAALCLVVGVVPGLVIDALAPVMQLLVGGRMPVQTQVAWLSIVPIAESRSSYNGLLVFVFVAASASLAVLAIHRLASRALRRAPAWDCGYPEPSPATQYTALSFAQPIRRVYGTLLFRAREQVELPPPGDLRPARHVGTLQDVVWDWLYASIARAVGHAAGRLNMLQFLTIRRYLTLVFLALIGLLLVLAIWF